MYLFVKILHTTLGGLLLGGVLSTLLMFIATSYHRDNNMMRALSQQTLYYFWIAFLPLILLQIILALILITLKTPAISNTLIGHLFQLLMLTCLSTLTVMYALKRIAQVKQHAFRIAIVAWLFTFALLAWMVYFMAIISP